MGDKNNRICVVCGKSYYFCPNCNANQANPKPSWYSQFDSEQCKDIFNTLTNYFLKKITVQEAKEALSAYDLNDISDYDVDIQQQIKDIMGDSSDKVDAEEPTVFTRFRKK